MFLVLFGLLAGGIITGGAWTLWQLNASLPSSNGGDFQVGHGLLLAVLITAITGIAIAIWMMLRKQRAQGTSSAQAQRNEGLLRALDKTEHALARVLQILLGMAAGGVVVAGIWMITRMDVSSKSQAGNIFVGIGMLVALGCITGMYISIEKKLKK